MKKRGQAATEFLTTYGWAILILMIVIVALAALGIFKGPSSPNICNSVTPIYCSDVKLTSSKQITLVLSASGTSTQSGLETRVTQISLTRPESISCSLNTVISQNQHTSVTCTFTGTNYNAGNRFSGEAIINYILRETESLGAQAQHTTKVTFSGTVE